MATELQTDQAGSLRILVISGGAPGGQDPSTDAAWSLAEVLSRSHDVILAVPEITGASHRLFAVVYYNRRNVGLLAKDSDVVIFDRSVFLEHPALGASGEIEATDLSELKNGFLAGRPLGPETDLLREPAAGELFLLRPFPPKKTRPGPSHYLRRLRFHLRRGGYRYAARRGASLIKRKIRGRTGS